MRLQESSTPAPADGRRTLPWHVVKAPRHPTPRLRSRAFWGVQAMVGLLTVSHYLVEGVFHDTPLRALHDIPVILYTFPIIYASLQFRMEGGLLTGLWCALLAVPNAILWHRDSTEWLIEGLQIGVGILVALVLSSLVEQEERERRKAEEMANRLTLVNQQIIRAQEDERRRIARELHDDTAQNLILLCRQLDRLAAVPRLRQEVAGSLRDLRSTADGALENVRRFSRDLRPSVLDDLGLVAAVEWLTEDIQKRSGIEARLEVSGNQRRLPPEAELGLFRIVQEALRNVERHSGASHVAVRLAFEGEYLHLAVRDDGHGFALPDSPNDLLAHGHLGLVGMQERVQLLGGNLQLQTEVGKGTAVAVALGYDAAVADVRRSGRALSFLEYPDSPWAM